MQIYMRKLEMQQKSLEFEEEIFNNVLHFRLARFIVAKFPTNEDDANLLLK